VAGSEVKSKNRRRHGRFGDHSRLKNLNAPFENLRVRFENLRGAIYPENIFAILRSNGRHNDPPLGIMAENEFAGSYVEGRIYTSTLRARFAFRKPLMISPASLSSIGILFPIVCSGSKRRKRAPRRKREARGPVAIRARPYVPILFSPRPPFAAIAVGTYQNGVDLAHLHDRGGHVIADKGHRESRRAMSSKAVIRDPCRGAGFHRRTCGIFCLFPFPH